MKHLKKGTISFDFYCGPAGLFKFDLSLTQYQAYRYYKGFLDKNKSYLNIYTSLFSSRNEYKSNDMWKGVISFFFYNIISSFGKEDIEIILVMYMNIPSLITCSYFV